MSDVLTEEDLDQTREEFERRAKEARKIVEMESPPEVPENYTPYEYPCSYCS